MKRLLFTFGLLLFVVKSFTQEYQVEKSVFGVQVGVYPISVYNECRLADLIALRSEIGFSYEYASSVWSLTPDFNLEPRFYYNLKRRGNLNKRIENNSGNYVSVNFGYGSGDLAIKSKNTNVNSSFHIIPMYGMRRNLGKSFNIELALGIGSVWTFKEYDTYNFDTKTYESEKETESDISYGFRLAVGYAF